MQLSQSNDFWFMQGEKNRMKLTLPCLMVGICSTPNTWRNGTKSFSKSSQNLSRLLANSKWAFMLSLYQKRLPSGHFPIEASSVKSWWYLLMSAQVLLLYFSGFCNFFSIRAGLLDTSLKTALLARALNLEGWPDLGSVWMVPYFHFAIMDFTVLPGRFKALLVL